MSFRKTLGSKMLGAAALLAVLCAPVTSFAGEISTGVAHPFVQMQRHSDGGCGRAWNGTYHYRYHYRAYRPRVSATPRKYYPRKKKKPLIGF